VTATIADPVALHPVALHPVEVDLLCALAEVRAPFPLDIPSVGTTHEQRRHLFGVARAQLSARGLADNRGPQGIAATFVRMLRSCAGTVDLVLAHHGVNRGAVAMVDGPRTLLAAQSPDEATRIVRMVELPTDDAVRELFGLVPALAPGGVPAFTVPLRPIREVFGRLDRRRQATGTVTPLSEDEIEGLLWESGVDERVAARLLTTMTRISGSGQIGATRRRAASSRWQRLPGETHWVLDRTADDQWASVGPLSRNDIRAVTRELAALVRGVE
jgi:hypothetical protein